MWGSLSFLNTQPISLVIKANLEFNWKSLVWLSTLKSRYILSYFCTYILFFRFKIKWFIKVLYESILTWLFSWPDPCHRVRTSVSIESSDSILNSGSSLGRIVVSFLGPRFLFVYLQKNFCVTLSSDTSPTVYG